MTLALEHKINNPLEGRQKAADLYGVSKSSFYLRTRTRPYALGLSTPLYRVEEELVKKIHEYAERGIPLTQRHVVELAEAVHDGELGVNWGTRFIHQRHRDTMHPRFFSYKELGSLQAGTPEIRRTLYYLVHVF